VIWPVVARYLVACAAGYVAATGTTLEKVFWPLVLAACVMRDIWSLTR
jgi:uncharacterized membrane protein YccC